MDTLFATSVIGIALITIAGSALYLFYGWRKHSLAQITEERALIAHREQVMSEREKKEKRARSKEAKKARAQRRALRKKAQFEAQKPDGVAGDVHPTGDVESKGPLRVV